MVILLFLGVKDRGVGVCLDERDDIHDTLLCLSLYPFSFLVQVLITLEGGVPARNATIK